MLLFISKSPRRTHQTSRAEENLKYMKVESEGLAEWASLLCLGKALSPLESPLAYLLPFESHNAERLF